MTSSDPLNRAAALLARREYARSELRERLLREYDDAPAVDAALDTLETRRLLSDQRFAEALVHDHAARWGNRRLAQELRRRGVADEMAAEVLAQAGADELARCREVWRRKYGETANDARERARQVRFLAGRGFSMSTIFKVTGEHADDD